MGKINNGIVSVNAYGIYNNITFSLIVKIFKPKGKLKESDKYKTKIELSSEIITELMEFGFNIKLVLADSLYGESSQFIKNMSEYNERLCSVNSVVIMESGCQKDKALGQISGVNLREHLAIKNQKIDTLGK